MMNEYIDLLIEQYEKKNKAYGNNADETYRRFGDTAYIIRISDKLKRLERLLSDASIDTYDESILDTYGDLFTYIALWGESACNINVKETMASFKLDTYDQAFAKQWVGFNYADFVLLTTCSDFMLEPVDFDRFLRPMMYSCLVCMCDILVDAMKRGITR